DHDVAHEAVVGRIAPGVIVSELDHEVALCERQLLCVEDEGAVPARYEAVVDRAGLVHDRAAGLAAPLVAASPLRVFDRLMQRNRMRVLGRIVSGRHAQRTYEAQETTMLRRIVVERRGAVVAIAPERDRHCAKAPELDHAAAGPCRIGPDIGRGTVVDHAGASLRIVPGHHAPHRLELVRHCLLPSCCVLLAPTSRLFRPRESGDPSWPQPLEYGSPRALDDSGEDRMTT